MWVHLIPFPPSQPIFYACVTARVSMSTFLCVCVCVSMASWLIAAFELCQTTGASLSQSLMAHLSLGDPLCCTCPPAPRGRYTHIYTLKCTHAYSHEHTHARSSHNWGGGCHSNPVVSVEKWPPPPLPRPCQEANIPFNIILPLCHVWGFPEASP